VREAAAQQLLLPAAMAGRAPLANLGPIAVAVAAFCVALQWHAHCAQPEAGYRVRYPAENLLQAVGFLGSDRIQLSGSGMQFCGRKSSDSSAHDACFTMRNESAAQLMFASEARVLEPKDRLGAPSRTMIQCNNGFLLLAAAGQSPIRVQYASMEWDTHLAPLLRPDKQSLLPLHHYASDELARYREQVELSARSGILVEDAELRRSHSIELIRWLRTTTSSLPMIAILLIALVLRRSPHGAFATRDVAWMAIAIVAGVLVRIALEARAAKLGTIASPWWALSPPTLTLLLGAPLAARGSNR
jgi:hypothetical protein